MSSLLDIEAATQTLTRDQKRALFVFLAQQLKADDLASAAPRIFSKESIYEWIAEDEADMSKLRDDA